MKIKGNAFRTIVTTLAFIGAAGVTQVSNATGSVGKADLTGYWHIALTGQTGCGETAMSALVNLNSSGSGTVTLHTHAACGDSTTTEKFTISTLGTDGYGTAGLSCNNDNGCGWEFAIQVSADRSTFSLVDISDPKNYLMGVAVHTS